MEGRLHEQRSGCALIIILCAEICLAMTTWSEALTTGPAMDQPTGLEPKTTKTYQNNPSYQLRPTQSEGGSQSDTTLHSAQTASPSGNILVKDKDMTNANSVAPGTAAETIALASPEEFGTSAATGGGTGVGTEVGTGVETEGGTGSGTRGGTGGGTGVGTGGGTGGGTEGGTGSETGGGTGGVTRGGIGDLTVGGIGGGAGGVTKDGTGEVTERVTEGGIGGRNSGGSVSHFTSAPGDESLGVRTDGTGLENDKVTERYTLPTSLGNITDHYTTPLSLFENTTNNYTTPPYSLENITENDTTPPSSLGNTTNNYTISRSSLGNTTENETFILPNMGSCYECHSNECENLTMTRTCQTDAKTCYILYDLEITALTLGCTPLIPSSEPCSDDYVRAATYCEYCCRSPDYCNDFTKSQINLKAWCTGENGGAILTERFGAVFVYSTAMYLLWAMESV